MKPVIDKIQDNCPDNSRGCHYQNNFISVFNSKKTYGQKSAKWYRE